MVFVINFVAYSCDTGEWESDSGGKDPGAFTTSTLVRRAALCQTYGSRVEVRPQISVSGSQWHPWSSPLLFS